MQKIFSEDIARLTLVYNFLFVSTSQALLHCSLYRISTFVGSIGGDVFEWNVSKTNLIFWMPLKDGASNPQPSNPAFVSFMESVD